MISSGIQKCDLATAVLLGRRSQKLYISSYTETLQRGRQSDKRNHTGGRYQVVAAGMAESRKCVIFRIEIYAASS